MKWKYRFERIDTLGMYRVGQRIDQWDSVDALGAMGWELVSVFGAEGIEATAVFKRPVATAEADMKALSDSGEPHPDIPF